jgi:hypothetical protein
MRRSALRPSFVVTFAVGAAAIAGGCNSGSGGNGFGSDAGCPAEQPTSGAPCEVPSSTSCGYEMCNGGPAITAQCLQGAWSVQFLACNPPAPVYEAGPDVDDAAPDVSDAGPDVHDGGSDGEGQDGGHD